MAGALRASSILSILATFWLLRWTQRNELVGTTDTDVAISQAFARRPDRGDRPRRRRAGASSCPRRSAGARTADAGRRPSHRPRGDDRRALEPPAARQGVSWDTLVLVAGLFVIVRALEVSGLQATLIDTLQGPLNAAPDAGAFASGTALAFGTNLTNNLPLGLLAGAFTTAADLPQKVVDAILVGIDIGRTCRSPARWRRSCGSRHCAGKPRLRRHGLPAARLRGDAARARPRASGGRLPALGLIATTRRAWVAGRTKRVQS